MPIKRMIAVLLMLSFIAIPVVAQEQRISHVVFCWLKEPGNPEHRQQVIEQSKRLTEIPGVLEIRAGEMVPSKRKIVDSTFDVAIYMTFANQQAMDSYIVHPFHKEIVKEKLKPLVSKILVYDFIEK